MSASFFERPINGWPAGLFSTVQFAMEDALSQADEVSFILV
jgi:hypothetical protein